MKRVRWGVMSTAKIGMKQVIPAMMQAEHVEMAAMASRSLKSARAAADSLSIPGAYDSYEALLAAPEIDAVYIPLPNHMHVEWAVKAIRAGKHVLVEKPMGLDAHEAEILNEAAADHPGIKVMEGFMYRHHPQWKLAEDIVVSGQLGELRTVQSFFSYFNADPANIRNRADVGGGALMDIGCYCISWARMLFRLEPVRALGLADMDPTFGTDRQFSGLLDFGQGRSSSFGCSTQMAPYQRVNAVGTMGRLEVMIPCNAPTDAPCVVRVHADGHTDEIEVNICNQYTIQGELMSRAILDDTPVPTSLEDGVLNMRVIDALKQSTHRGSWVAM